MNKFYIQEDSIITEHINSIDWENNPLGDMEKWPQSLKTALNICLNSPFPMLIVWGPQMVMLYNSGYAAFLDAHDPYGALGKPAKEIWAEIWDKTGPMLENVQRTGKAVWLEDQLFSIKSKGEREDRYFTFSYSSIQEENEVGGVLNIVYETTGKVLNDRRLKVEQERMHRVFMQAPAAICILNGPEMIFELVNPVYQQIFSGRDLLGKELLIALPEIKGAPILDVLMNVYHTGKSFEGTELLVPLSKNKDAPLENHYFDFTYQARINEQKQIDGIMVFAYEVTEFVEARKAAEQLALKVEQQAKTFDVTLSAIKDTVYTFDAEGRFTYSNQPLLDFLGMTLDQLIGKKFYDLPYPPAISHKLQSQINRVIAHGETITDEVEVANSKGKKGFYEHIFSPVFDHEGKVALIAGSSRDISERKKSEEAIGIKNKELTHLNKELTKVNADLDSFIYAASHDLKAPISNIEGLVNALRDFFSKQNEVPPAVDKLLEMITSSIDRFNKTIQDLSDITKLQRLKEDKETRIDIKEVIEGIKLDLSFLLKQTNGSIRVEGDQLERINFSPKNLRSVLYNLISNGIKYRSPERDPVVIISSEEDHDYSIITVRDNGLGMDLSGGEFIFGMFQRMHSHVEGSGIGLYIVKKIMTNAEGKIEVDSKVGVGSTFKLFFKK